MCRLVFVLLFIHFHRTRVKNMFYHAYNGYLQYAYPFDELKPISCKGMDTWGSFALTLVDSLDTLVVLGNMSEFRRVSELVLSKIDVNANVNVSVFETNIRVIGGLLSAHMLSKMGGLTVEDGWPCSGPFLRLAERLAWKLLPAFNTDTGMPYGTINLRYGVHRKETPVTCTAGVGTFLLEFGALSRLTGNDFFEKIALKALEELWLHRSNLGMVGNHIDVKTGQWTAVDSGIGAGVDSYFEYLVKGGALFSHVRLLKQFKAYKAVIDKYMKHDDWFFWVSSYSGKVSMPVFQSLEAFWPGLLTLVGNIEEARRIMVNYYSVLRNYGFLPEFFNIPQMDPVHKRSGYPLRPGNLVYLYRATEDPLLLQIGAEMIEAIDHATKAKCGYATVHNVATHSLEDRMESFFLAETTKYLYLLFDPDNFLHNSGEEGTMISGPFGNCVINSGGYVYNTEAHPLDPSILYCCSSKRQKEFQTLAYLEDKLDVISLLDIRNEPTVKHPVETEAFQVLTTVKNDK
ncbi:unnamed protein product [Soboliphyme baturini]|uniref:alpha-1,2-Mannosidase n=1 Tax=Soboliphyme baturini TaxID=241478 RepID=A0A183IRC8_9BILA|nr:unnamed protein product [Soboliphyme baturini]